MAYNEKYHFEWDEKKNSANFRKHGIWFEEAQTIWADGHAAEFLDVAHSITEERFIRMGNSSRARVLVTIFCERDEGQVIRIVSARKATRREQLQYEEGI